MSDPSQRVSFHIEGLDCAEEVAVLRRVIGPLVGGEGNLSFEVLNAKMSLLDGSVRVSEKEIVEAGQSRRNTFWQSPNTTNKGSSFYWRVTAFPSNPT